MIIVALETCEHCQTVNDAAVVLIETDVGLQVVIERIGGEHNLAVAKHHIVAEMSNLLVAVVPQKIGTDINILVVKFV